MRIKNQEVEVLPKTPKEEEFELKFTLSKEIKEDELRVVEEELMAQMPGLRAECRSSSGKFPTKEIVCRFKVED